jgi:hypothetical protein
MMNGIFAQTTAPDPLCGGRTFQRDSQTRANAFILKGREELLRSHLSPSAYYCWLSGHLESMQVKAELTKDRRCKDELVQDHLEFLRTVWV